MRIRDVLYLDMNGEGEFYNEDNAWDTDTLEAIAKIVRSVLPVSSTEPATGS